MEKNNSNEVQGKHVDQGAKDDHQKVKKVTIVVNARQVEVEKGELTFDEVVGLAYDNPATGENILFTVSYFKGHGEKPEGSMVQGDTVKAKEGMVINVSQTDKS